MLYPHSHLDRDNQVLHIHVPSLYIGDALLPIPKGLASLVARQVGLDYNLRGDVGTLTNSPRMLLIHVLHSSLPHSYRDSYPYP